MNFAVAIPSFLASSVEFVEALTIVLAIGVTRGWRSAILGAIAASALLLAITAAFGVTLTQLVPISVLRVVVGSLILLFGIKWLRKAILRFTGLKASHDEEQIFREEANLARAHARVAAGQMDWFGFIASFKAVALEGLEVAFIVIALGATAHALGSAAVGAAAAGVLVIGAGLAIAQPLARVPENLLKFVVGVMLTTFGTFWTAEGLGADWWQPGGWPADISLLPILTGYLLISVVLILALRRSGERAVRIPTHAEEAASS
jgi:uncharacterized membrane protein